MTLLRYLCFDLAVAGRRAPRYSNAILFAPLVPAFFFFFLNFIEFVWDKYFVCYK